MEVILKPGNAKYRVIVRNEHNNLSKSFGVYDVDLELPALLRILKDILDNAKQDVIIEEKSQ